MTLEPLSTPAFDFLVRVAQSYAGLLQMPGAHAEMGLGGKLFYAGELDDASRALLVAANIAGAATLAATADHAMQKQALRDGVADFVVHNLDEALRILKNQLRKQETVSICVALPTLEIEQEMSARGVAPDLLRSDAHIAPLTPLLMFQPNLESSAVQQSPLAEADFGSTPALLTWRVDSALPKDLAQIDEIALACLDPGEGKSRRWLRLAPRYLGRMAHSLRLLESNREFAARFIDRVRQAAENGEIKSTVEIATYIHGRRDEFRNAPTSP